MEQANESRLVYRVRRSGPEVIIFIHGLGASKSSFDACFELEPFRSYTLAAVDLPGCGESEWLEHFSYSMRDQADLVLKWISYQGLAPTILVGHSMGGVIGLFLAETLRPRVEKFFNLEGNLTREDCTFSGKIASLSQEVFEKRGLQQFKRSLRETLQKDPSPGIRKYYESISRASPQALYFNSVSLVQESCQGNLKEKFLKVPGKKWYVFGEKSVKPSTRRFLDDNSIPYFIVPESGHFMMDDQPSLFYNMLLDALANKDR